MYQISHNPGHKCSFRPSYIHCIKDLTKCLHVFPFNTTPALMNRADNQCALLNISACYQKYHFWGGGLGGGICKAFVLVMPRSQHLGRKSFSMAQIYKLFMHTLRCKPCHVALFSKTVQFMSHTSLLSAW